MWLLAGKLWLAWTELRSTARSQSLFLSHPGSPETVPLSGLLAAAAQCINTAIL